MIRSIIILCITIAALAADVEQFSLSDGRKLIGTYDASTQALTCLQGGIPVTIRVAPGQIVARKPAAVPVAPERVGVKAAEPALSEPSRPPVGQVQPSPLTKEQVLENERQREAEADVRRAKDALRFTERFGKPYHLTIPTDAKRTKLMDLPENLRGRWDLVRYSKEHGDMVQVLGLIRTGNASWEHHSENIIRSVVRVSSAAGDDIGYEIDVRGDEPYFVRFVDNHLVALTIGKDTDVYCIEKLRGP